MKCIVLFLLGVFSSAALAQECRIEYQRADNMWAAPGRPDGPLGAETLTLKPGERKVFITDWKYEKQRNDGTNYYGSHVRILRNTGTLPVRLTMTGQDLKAGAIWQQVVGQRASGELKPGQADTSLRADLQEVSCPAAAAKPSQPPLTPPGGLTARQNSPHDIVLGWLPVPNAKEYRVYVSPPPQPHLEGKPAVLSGSGRHFVITIPRNNPPPAYHASIEAVGQDGSVSPRVNFPTVAVQIAGGGGGAPSGGPSSGGPSSSPSTPASSGGQQCPPGQFVTGISASGQIACAAPR